MLVHQVLLLDFFKFRKALYDSTPKKIKIKLRVHHPPIELSMFDGTFLEHTQAQIGDRRGLI